MKPITLGKICQILDISPPSPCTQGEGRGEGDFASATALNTPKAPHPSPLAEYKERGKNGSEILIRAVCTDSRQMQGESLFVALRGEKFDGHAFLPKAAMGGALAALVDRAVASPPRGLPLLQVPDARQAMGQLARHVRRQFGGKVITVAGSNGKTSVKHLIDAVLRSTLSGSISPKSFNNDIGVPLAIFPADPQQDYLVLELGTNHPGEIRLLTRIALPDLAVITNCSAEHLEGLGDLAGVRRENASLIEGLGPDGVLIVNGDDRALLREVAGFAGRRITFGLSPENDLYVSDVRCGVDGTHFTFQPQNTRCFVPLLGRHSAVNSLAAIAVGWAMGLSDREIMDNLQSARGAEMRLQWQQGRGVRILNDAYNANPASMQAAIQTLASLPAAGRRIAVLGDMRELGEAAQLCHRQIGQFLGAEFPPDRLICVGPLGRMIGQEAVRAGFPVQRIAYFPDAASATALAGELADGDVVLLKASRAMHLEIVAGAILAGPAAPRPLAAAS